MSRASKLCATSVFSVSLWLEGLEQRTPQRHPEKAFWNLAVIKHFYFSNDLQKEA
jgi:hypothetical protein